MPDAAWWSAWKAEVETAGPSWFESRYHGFCRACGLPWQPGEMICWWEDEQGYVCTCVLADEP
jgi:hypothetical protein